MAKFKLLLLVFVSASFMMLSGCASNESDENLSVEELYNKAHYYMDKTRYKKAAETFEKVELEFPYSKWATDAKLMGAYAHYKDKNYDDAIISLDRFIRFHPGNKDIAYAYYLKAICYYDQVADVDREQGATEKALQAMSQLVARFPNTAYAKDVEQKMIFATDNLAGKEMEIGRYYLAQKSYLSALNRFSVVVAKYNNTKYIEEALYRQVELYTILGLYNEANTAYTVLAHNYPKNDWTVKAQKILKKG